MTTFEQKHAGDLHGILEGFDRIIFRGYLQSFFSTNGFGYFLYQENVLLKDYGTYVKSVTIELKNHIERVVEDAG